MTLTSSRNFRQECKKWREYRKLSQLELALDADISQRHISYLETGRSQPSRDMVIRLSEALDIPLRERNVLLQSAGFSAMYSETGLDEPSMRIVLDALNHVLKHHDPFPAVVVDGLWNVKKQNRAAAMLFTPLLARPEVAALLGKNGEINLALLTLHPDALRANITNWEQAAPLFIKRLRSEAAATGDPEVKSTFEKYIALSEPIEMSTDLTDPLLPVMPLEMNINGLALSLFSVISTFGTPQDITTDELRVEAFYPATPETENFFKHAALENKIN